METCPICGLPPLPKTGDADGFDCPMHNRFRVAGTVLATRSGATRQEWEKAFDRAKARTKPDENPRYGCRFLVLVWTLIPPKLDPPRTASISPSTHSSPIKLDGFGQYVDDLTTLNLCRWLLKFGRVGRVGRQIALHSAFCFSYAPIGRIPRPGYAHRSSVFTPPPFIDFTHGGPALKV